MWRATLSMALQAIRRNTLRSLLTTLGIIIGVASVITMVTLGEAATARVTADIAALGTNMLIVSPTADRRGPVSSGATAFTPDDVKALRHELPDSSQVAPTAMRSALVVFGNANYSTSVTGITPEYLQIRNHKLAAGRAFSDTETLAGTPVCLLGETVRQRLYGAQSPLDTTIRVGKVACAVIGVMEAKGQSTFGMDQDDFILMPLVAVQRRLAGNTDVGAVYVTVSDDSAMSRTKAQLEGLLRERRRIAPGQSDDFSVQDMREIAKTIGSVTGVLTALLGAVAAVSLLVGGIGIMNIMLVSVTERTREIGIRLAIGALGSEVLLQFLLESVLLCLIGGGVGVALGLGGSYVAARFMSLPFSINPMVVLVAFVFSAAIGIAFGYLPARRAARLNPIEALRHE